MRARPSPERPFLPGKPWQFSAMSGTHLPLGNAGGLWLRKYHKRFKGMERMTGIEPAMSDWKSEVLPLYYIRIYPPLQVADDYF